MVVRSALSDFDIKSGVIKKNVAVVNHFKKIPKIVGSNNDVFSRFFNGFSIEVPRVVNFWLSSQSVSLRHFYWICVTKSDCLQLIRRLFSLNVPNYVADSDSMSNLNEYFSYKVSISKNVTLVNYNRFNLLTLTVNLVNVSYFSLIRVRPNSNFKVWEHLKPA